jgi:hypothetical protein
MKRGPFVEIGGLASRSVEDPGGRTPTIHAPAVRLRERWGNLGPCTALTRTLRCSRFGSRMAGKSL